MPLIVASGHRLPNPALDYFEWRIMPDDVSQTFIACVWIFPNDSRDAFRIALDLSSWDNPTELGERHTSPEWESLEAARDRVFRTLARLAQDETLRANFTWD